MLWKEIEGYGGNDCCDVAWKVRRGIANIMIPIDSHVQPLETSILGYCRLDNVGSFYGSWLDLAVLDMITAHHNSLPMLPLYTQ